MSGEEFFHNYIDLAIAIPLLLFFKVYLIYFLVYYRQQFGTWIVSNLQSTSAHFEALLKLIGQLLNLSWFLVFTSLAYLLRLSYTHAELGYVVVVRPRTLFDTAAGVVELSYHQIRAYNTGFSWISFELDDSIEGNPDLIESFVSILLANPPVLSTRVILKSKEVADDMKQRIKNSLIEFVIISERGRL